MSNQNNFHEICFTLVRNEEFISSDGTVFDSWTIQNTRGSNMAFFCTKCCCLYLKNLQVFVWEFAREIESCYTTPGVPSSLQIN